MLSETRSRSPKAGTISDSPSEVSVPGVSYSIYDRLKVNR